MRPTNKKDQGLRIVIGLHSCEEVVRVRPKSIVKFFIDDSKEKELSTIEWVKKLSSRLRPEKRSRNYFQELGSGHQGVALAVEEGEPQLSEDVYDKDKSTLLALDEVEDPTNLGNILRTAWLLNVDGILIPKDRSVKLTPTVCKIASGGAEHVPVEVVHPLDQHLTQLKDHGYWVYGLDANAKSTVYDVEFGDKVIIVAGNEGKGLRKTTLNVCDVLIKIPQTCDRASLNVSTSVAITLSHVQRAFFESNKKESKK